ncbi:Sentrin-specific protease 2 [Frankliniella fusca]|uniref:Sentrin-specific protease 2 n=1 Tax=Frankliniella fusca TaxID=407009 RepID=A0AAE1GXV2_9NEOP|nr:Sentrin-specific protease 2 [Frankliniella fusca]
MPRKASLILNVIDFRTTMEVYLTSDVPFVFPRIPEKYVGPGSELTDTVIDRFISILIAEAERVVEKKSFDAAKVLSFEVSLLHNVSMGLPYKERLSQNKLFYDAWLVPTQVERNHFVLIVVLMRKKVIIILDSLNRNVSKATVESVKCFGHDLNLKEWSIHAPMDVIQQKNVTDCCDFVWGTFLKKSPDLESVSRLRVLLYRTLSRLRNWIATMLLDNLSQSPEIR